MTNWTGVVGLAGIAGTLGGIYLTNKAAERRMRLRKDSGI